MGALAGKIAVVTGGGRGIGRSIARLFAREGADVAICARSRPEIDAVVAELRGSGRRSFGSSVDVSDWQSVRAFADGVAEALGNVDVLVNNAGVFATQKMKIAESDPDTWWRVVEVNLKGMYLVTRAFVGGMNDGGKILNIGSGMGHEAPSPGDSSYRVAKAGVRLFTRVLATEIWERGIQVNEIVPGLVANGLDPEGKIEEMRTSGTPPRFAPSERLKHPDRVAELALWLATRGEDGPMGQSFSLARRPL
jgi:NAD(P)-dependent dehydrogenase (short-subunit alcohol dehydrogenase family)